MDLIQRPCLLSAVQDVDLSRDPRDFQEKLEQGERSFVSSVLGYLAASGG